jgi:hypothetical protein
MEASITRPITLAIGLVFVIVLGILAVWGLAPGDVPDVPPGLTEVKDPAELEKMIEISRIGILTSTNYLGHRVYTVRGTLKNIAAMPIRLVAVTMTFRDYDKKAIHAEERPAFEPKQRPLEPGTEYRFEIAFEDPPSKWNYHVPDTHVVRIAY